MADVDWLTEALANMFQHQQQGGPQPPPLMQGVPSKPKAAWGELTGKEPVVTAQNRNQCKQWAEQWRILAKREDLAAAGARGTDGTALQHSTAVDG